MNQEILKSLRERYKTVVSWLDGANTGLFAQSSYLRIDQPLVNGQGNYVFDPMKSNGPGGTFDRKLDRNDAFMVTGFSLCFYAKSLVDKSACVLVPNPDTIEDTNLPTIVSPVVGTVPTGLSNVYNGKLMLKTGTKVTFDGFPTLPFRWQRFVSDYDINEAAYYLPEILSLAGTKDQAFELSFPTTSSTILEAVKAEANPANFELGVSLFLQGYMVKNGAIFVSIDDNANKLVFM